jgi:small subunit ribosomal protein S7e
VLATYHEISISLLLLLLCYVLKTVFFLFPALVRLTRELEKKFSDCHVVFVAQRRMLPKPTRTSRVGQKRPRSRTLTNVHERILEDLVFPTEIVGKRTRIAVDGSKLLKV